MHELRNSPRKILLGDRTFRKIRLRDKEMFAKYTKLCEYPANLWLANFAYLWADSQSSRKKILWTKVEDMLVPFVLRQKSGLNLVCLPFGKGDPDCILNVLRQCLEFCNDWNKQHGFRPGTVRTVNASQLTFLQSSKLLPEFFEYKKLRGTEQHFSIPSLVQLVGKDFHSVRHSINVFNREYPNAVIRRYCKDDYEQLSQINENWMKGPGKHYSVILDKVYFRKILQNHKALDHIILIIEVEGRLVGMVTGGLTPAGQSWGCLIKKMADVKGLNEYMIIEFIREINRIDPSVEFVNVGSDLGVQGLVTFKEKFRPVLSLERYRLWLK